MRRAITIGVLHTLAICMTFAAGWLWAENASNWWMVALGLAVLLLDLVTIHQGHLYGFAEGVVAERHAVPSRGYSPPSS